MKYSYKLPDGSKLTVDAKDENEAVSLVHQQINPQQIEDVIREGVEQDGGNDVNSSGNQGFNRPLK